MTKNTELTLGQWSRWGIDELPVSHRLTASFGHFRVPFKVCTKTAMPTWCRSFSAYLWCREILKCVVANCMFSNERKCSNFQSWAKTVSLTFCHLLIFRHRRMSFSLSTPPHVCVYACACARTCAEVCVFVYICWFAFVNLLQAWVTHENWSHLRNSCDKNWCHGHVCGGIFSINLRCVGATAQCRWCHPWAGRPQLCKSGSQTGDRKQSSKHCCSMASSSSPCTVSASVLQDNRLEPCKPKKASPPPRCFWPCCLFQQQKPN